MIDGAPTVTHGSDGQLVILAQDEEGIVWQRRDPEFQTGIDPAQLWTRIAASENWLVRAPVLAPGCSAGSPVFLWPGGIWAKWAFRIRVGELTHWVYNGVAFAGGSLCNRRIASTIEVAPRPGGGFYLAARGDCGGLCVMTANLDEQAGLQILTYVVALNVTGSGDLSMVADSRDGRPVVFSLNASRAVEERWF